MGKSSGQTDEQAEGMEAHPPQEMNVPEALPAQEADAGRDGDGGRKYFRTSG